MQIIANRAPIGFEAEFANQREKTICYRGILMPFSSDGETIDFIYGVINWKSTDCRLAAEGQQGLEGASHQLGEAQDNAPIDEPLELTQIVGATATMLARSSPTCSNSVLWSTILNRPQFTALGKTVHSPTSMGVSFQASIWKRVPALRTGCGPPAKPPKQ